jgi:hypothetical protein
MHIVPDGELFFQLYCRLPADIVMIERHFRIIAG